MALRANSGGYRVIAANGLAQPKSMVSRRTPLPSRTNHEAEIIARLLARLPELVKLERDQNQARSWRKPQPLRIKPVTIGDLIKSGKPIHARPDARVPGVTGKYPRW